MNAFNFFGKKYLSKRKFQSLLGKLVYLHKCVVPARIFVNRNLQLFGENFNKQKLIYLSDDFVRDIAWFQAVLPQFNCTTKFVKPTLEATEPLCLDACLTGVGAIWANRVYSAPVPSYPGFALKIVHLEMLNIVIALHVWGKYWRHVAVTVNCDNEACVHVIATNRTKDPFLGACIRNLWFVTAFYDISLQVQHISRLYSNKPINHELFDHLKANYMWDSIDPSYFDLNLSIKFQILHSSWLIS